MTLMHVSHEKITIQYNSDVLLDSTVPYHTCTLFVIDSPSCVLQLFFQASGILGLDSAKKALLDVHACDYYISSMCPFYNVFSIVEIVSPI